MDSATAAPLTLSMLEVVKLSQFRIVIINDQLDITVYISNIYN